MESAVAVEEECDSTRVFCHVFRHFLSCDNVADMTEWASAINECLEALRLWNIVPEMRHEPQAYKIESRSD